MTCKNSNLSSQSLIPLLLVSKYIFLSSLIFSSGSELSFIFLKKLFKVKSISFSLFKLSFSYFLLSIGTFEKYLEESQTLSIS